MSVVVLLVGVVIVGLVSTVVVIGIRGRNKPPTTAACDADQSALSRAEQTFHRDHGRYGTEEELVAAGLLKATSRLHGVTMIGDSYDLVATHACAGVTSSAPVATPTLRLVFDPVPATATAGRLIDPPITVRLTDGGGVLLRSTAEVTISLEASNGAQLSGNTTVRAVDGVATFSNLAIDKVGSGYSFAAEASGTTATSSPVAVNPGSAARLRFVASPSSATPGQVFPTQPVVEVEDVMGNVIVNASDPIVLAITDHTGPRGARLACDNVSLVPTAGVARFGGCQINVAGTDYTLTATAMELDGRSDTFAVTGRATKLVVVQQPTQAVAGETLSPTAVAVEDSAGNIVTDSDATVALTVNQNSGSLTGTTSVAVVDGVATFTDLAIATSATNYAFTTKASGLKTATSAVFDVATGPAAQLVFTRQPSGGRAGKSWSTQPIVTVEDAFGNVVIAGIDEIALQLTAGGGTPAAELACAEDPVAAVNGAAVFTRCSINLPGSGYTLTATSGALSGVSASFSIA